MQELSNRFSNSLTLSLSSLESTTSPCLFVTHGFGKAGSTPTRLAQTYLSGNPSPQKTMEGAKLPKRDPNKHELAHIHITEGSLHIVLSPQDARKVVKRGWGELHRLSGLFYRGHYLPPYWLPTWFYNLLGGQSKLRWGYLQNKGDDFKGRLIPPTYCILYAPNNEEQIKWVKAILDSSVSWAMGQPL